MAYLISWYPWFLWYLVVTVGVLSFPGNLWYPWLSWYLGIRDFSDILWSPLFLESLVYSENLALPWHAKFLWYPVVTVGILSLAGILWYPWIPDVLIYVLSLISCGYCCAWYRWYPLISVVSMALNNTECDIVFLSSSALFHSIMFYSYSILFYFHSVLFLFYYYSIPFYFYYIQFYFYSILFYSIPFLICSITILLCSIPVPFCYYSILVLLLLYSVLLLFYSITVLLCSFPNLACSIPSKSKNATDPFSFSLGRTGLYGDRWRVCHVLMIWWTDDGCETVTAWVDGQKDGWMKCVQPLKPTTAVKKPKEYLPRIDWVIDLLTDWITGWNIEMTEWFKRLIELIDF